MFHQVNYKDENKLKKSKKIHLLLFFLILLFLYLLANYLTPKLLSHKKFLFLYFLNLKNNYLYGKKIFKKRYICSLNSQNHKNIFFKKLNSQK